MLLSNNKDFLFVHVPKTGGSSIVRVLAPHCLAPIKTPYRRLLSHLPVPENVDKAFIRQHVTAAWIRRKIPETYDNALTFAVVRDPYEWCVSYWRFVKRNKNSSTHARAQDWTLLDFLAYVRRRRATKDIRQSAWVTDKQGSLIVDELLRFENLNAEFDRLAATLGLSLALPHVNASPVSSAEYEFSAEEIVQINTLFADDFANFGYHQR